MVIGHGPPRQGVSIVASRSHSAAASACVQRITRRCAHRESTSSSSQMRRADSRQASLNSSKRNSPSTNTSASLAIRSRCFCQVSSKDRKSTRLNSSHSQISYAVFCLQKKKKTKVHKKLKLDKQAETQRT